MESPRCTCVGLDSPDHWTSKITGNYQRNIAKASAASGALSKLAFKSCGLPFALRARIYTAILLTVLLYSCETWIYNESSPDSVPRFQCGRLRFPSSDRDRAPAPRRQLQSTPRLSRRVGSSRRLAIARQLLGAAAAASTRCLDPGSKL